ncbi:MAG TPA: hypothetical protein V6C97_03060 [Oculatellaceae cyanobacterium]
MAFKMTLEEALKEALQDDAKVSKYEARVIREMIMSDGVITKDEKTFLENALQNNHFDDEAYELLSSLLLRTKTK